jgi:hypothetical protein
MPWLNLSSGSLRQQPSYLRHGDLGQKESEIVNLRTAVLVASACWMAAIAARSRAAQQTPPLTPIAAACGQDRVDFVVKKDTMPAPVEPKPVPGKALVYVIESMPNYPFVTKKVNIGMDGHWLGATDADTFMSFSAEPGVHHLCAVYQGHAESMDEEGHTLLLKMDLEAGKTYYVRYHALFLKDSPGIALFERVDEDEGQLLVEQTDHATSTRKK